MRYPTGPGRYRLKRLGDGRIEAEDTVDPLRCYVLRPRPAMAPSVSRVWLTIGAGSLPAPVRTPGAG